MMGLGMGLGRVEARKTSLPDSRVHPSNCITIFSCLVLVDRLSAYRHRMTAAYKVICDICECL